LKNKQNQIALDIAKKFSESHLEEDAR